MRCQRTSAAASFVELGVRLVALAFLVLWILHAGRDAEQRNIRSLPDTSHLYQTEQVCALHLPEEYFKSVLNETTRRDVQLVGKDRAPDRSNFGSNQTFHQPRSSSLEVLHSSVEARAQTSDLVSYPPLASVTYRSAELVRSQGKIVQHCGDCGQCSNPHDIAIYDETRNTLFRSSLQCSTLALLQGRKSASDCLERNVGFTKGCHDCWVENFMCTTRKCFFTCTWAAMFSNIKVADNNSSAPQELNECLQCDEKRCGPAFLQCAGANRRRVGIASDIQRSHREKCDATDDGWWKSESLQKYFRDTNKAAAAIDVE